MKVARADKKILEEVLRRYVQDYRREFQNLLSYVTNNEDPFFPRLTLGEPEPVRDFCERLQRIIGALAAMSEHGGELNDSDAPFIREAIVRERIAVATRVESHKTRTIDPGLTAQIETQLEPYDRIMRQPWLRDAPPLAVPHLRDYFPLHLLEGDQESKTVASRPLDEKFHILQAPFPLPARSYSRTTCRRTTGRDMRRGLS